MYALAFFAVAKCGFVGRSVTSSMIVKHIITNPYRRTKQAPTGVETALHDCRQHMPV